jgi:hypothetical protein
MGWMVWDLMRGLDLLLSYPGIDKDRIILLGSVAGGGDPAAVTAALDRRVTAVVPFNFGGPQPDYAIPPDPARDFYFFGVPDWESTRCLRLGARDGFAHWLIVAAVAPRHLIYAHEFDWDQARDPVWPRLNQVFDWYGVGHHIAVAHGRGTLRGRPPESSHCNNIGPLHRSAIYPNFKQWFDMPIPEEYSRRRDPEELLCLTPEANAMFHPRSLHELAAEAANQQATAAHRQLAGQGRDERRRWLRREWARLMGDVEPEILPVRRDSPERSVQPVLVERIVWEAERKIVVPAVLLFRAPEFRRPVPVVVGLAQEGKQAFLEHRSEAIAELLNGGVAVCLVDVRGTGETRPKDGSPRYNGTRTELSATHWLLGQTLVGSQLRDLRFVVNHLRKHHDIDPGRIALWGDSFAPKVPRDRNPAVPMDAEPYPNLAEPLGGLLALLGALFDDGIRAVVVGNGLIGYQTLLQSPFGYVPHDALIPGVLTTGDLGAVAASLAPTALRMEGLVDGLNREIPADVLTRTLEPVRAAYRSAGAESHLQFTTGGELSQQTARWLLLELRGD